jgi:hypothetical protein
MTLFIAQVTLIVVGGFCIAAGSFIIALILTTIHKLVTKLLGLDKNEKL